MPGSKQTQPTPHSLLFSIERLMDSLSVASSLFSEKYLLDSEMSAPQPLQYAEDSRGEPGQGILFMINVGTLEAMQQAQPGPET